MKLLKFLILCVVASVQSAPTTVNPLYQLIMSDARLEKLRENKFVAECRKSGEFSKSLCFAMYDVALSFNYRSLDFTKENASSEGGFCEVLTQVVPDTPANDESTNNFQEVVWFKDVLKKDDGQSACSDNCIYEDKQTYDSKVLPLCQFLLNQYSFLKNLSNASASQENPKLVENEFQSNETTKVVAKPVPAASVLQNNKSSDVTLKKSEEKPVTKAAADPVVVNEDVKSLVPTEPHTKSPNEQSTVAATATEKKSETAKSVIQSADDAEQAKADAEVKAEEAAKSEDTSKVNGAVKIDIEEKPDEGLLENKAAPDNTDVFLPENEDDTEKDHPDDKSPYEDEDEYHNDVDDQMVRDNNNVPFVKIQQEPDPTLIDEVPHKKVEIVDFEEDPDSNFFTYLCAMMFLCVLFYILHQNRQKILALFLEGRRGNRRGSRERTRGGSKAAYSKLDCNLEEAIMSKKSLSGKSMDIIY